MSDKTAMPQTGEFCWNELMTSNAAKAKEFYGALFGWECTDMDMGKMTYTLFKHKSSEEKGIGGMMQIPADQTGKIPPHWLSYISVEDVDASLKKAQSLGAKVLVPVTPISDFGKFTVIQDPQGASIALWQNLKSCKP